MKMWLVAFSCNEYWPHVTDGVHAGYMLYYSLLAMELLLPHHLYNH